MTIVVASPTAPPIHGLDIETDTATGGLDPDRSRILAAAVATEGGTIVLDDPSETRLLRGLDDLMAELPAGVIATWFGSGFDLPYVARRAEICSVALGLRTIADPRAPGRVAGAWHHHTHLDAHRLWAHVRTALGVSASLKSVAGHNGLRAVAEEPARVHELSPARLQAYVASDAELAASLARHQWSRAHVAIDELIIPPRQ
ncbi:MAG TPA: hypothetical protein VGA13_12915 [Acidimicrobiales bacterium]